MMWFTSLAGKSWSMGTMTAPGDGCQIGYHPAGVVSSYQRYLVSFSMPHSSKSRCSLAISLAISK